LTGTLPSELFDEDALEFKWQHLCPVSDRVANVLSKMVASKQLDRYPNAMETIKAIDLLLAPSVAPTITPTISSPAPTLQSPVQHASPATTQAPSPTPPAAVRKNIDRRKFIKWASLSSFGLIGVLVWSKVNEKSTTIPPTITPAAKASADNYSKSALQKYKKEDYQGALADFNRAMQLDPNNYADAYGYYSRGNLKHDKLNDTQGALADFNQAIQLNPKYADAYNSRGNLKYVKLNDTQGALADYNQAIQLNPKYADAYYNRCILKHDKLNDTQGAIDDYSQAIQLNPKNADAYTSRGNLKYVKLNDTQGAIDDTKQAAKIYKQEGRQKSYQDAIDRLKEWRDK
jgi:Tfp pilus assembly protein PilF